MVAPVHSAATTGVCPCCSSRNPTSTDCPARTSGNGSSDGTAQPPAPATDGASAARTRTSNATIRFMPVLHRAGRGGSRSYDRAMFIEPLDVGVEDEADAWAEEQTARWGYLPNYAAVFGSRPDVARAWTALNPPSAAAWTGGASSWPRSPPPAPCGSTYCTVAHSMFLRDVCGDEATMVALADDPDGGSLDDTDRAVVAFAAKVARQASEITQDDVDALRADGLSDNDVADVIFAVGARCFFATVLDAAGAEPDHQLAAALDTVAERLVVGRPIAAAPQAPDVRRPSRQGVSGRGSGVSSTVMSTRSLKKQMRSSTAVA